MRALVEVYKAAARAELAAVAKSVQAAIEPVPAAADAKKLYVPIAKLDTAKREITGIVLQPEVVDAQGDIISPEVIEKAAGDFLANYNAGNQLGLMHSDFQKRFELRQSFIAPGDIAIGSSIVKAGSWVMTVKVLEDKIWAKVEDGGLTGFSIGGKASAQKLDSAA